MTRGPNNKDFPVRIAIEISEEMSAAIENERKLAEGPVPPKNPLIRRLLSEALQHRANQRKQHPQ